MANGFPLLNIVLFNTDGDESVGAGDRYRCMDEILDSILAENYPNLFILANDKIRRPKHRKLCEKLHQNPADTPHREEAGVYYDTETNTHYDVEYVDELQQADDALGIEPGNDFAVSRLTACVLTPTADIEMGKILLVSWHGPWTRLGLGLLARQACFRRLVRFLELLKGQNDCDMVIVGGDFNLASGTARDLLGGVGGALLDNYIPTNDRPANRDPIDYVVYWPRGGLEDIEISVLRRDLRGTENNRPFDHCIVLYRFGDRFSDLVRKFESITVQDDEDESDNAEDEEESENAEDEEESDNAEDEEESENAEDEEESDNAEDEEESENAEGEEESENAEDEEESDNAEDEEESDNAEDEEGSENAEDEEESDNAEDEEESENAEDEEESENAEDEEESENAEDEEGAIMQKTKKEAIMQKTKKEAIMQKTKKER